MHSNSKGYLFIFSLVLFSILNSSFLFAQDWIKLGDDIDGQTVEEESGWSVSLNSDGTVVVIGAKFNGSAGNKAGEVTVHDYNDASNKWVQRGSDINGVLANDQFGYSVSINGDGSIIAVGAPNNDDGPGNNSGHVRVFKWDGAAWVGRGSAILVEAG